MPYSWHQIPAWLGIQEMQFKDPVMLFQKIIYIFSMNESALQTFKQSQEVY